VALAAPATAARPTEGRPTEGTARERGDPDVRRRAIVTDKPVLEAEVEQFEREARRIAAGGWRRAVIGLAIGALAGLAATVALPRDGGARPDREA
jgi:hypothetical protein